MPNQTFFNLSKKKQNRIIKAALSEFSKHGYNNSNLDCIIKTAKIPKGSLYQYFKNKDDFFSFIVKRALNKAWELFQEYIKNQSPRDCFDMFTLTLIFLTELRKKEPEIALLYIRVGFLKKFDSQKNILPNIYKKNDLFLENFFSWGIKNGIIDKDIDIKTAKFIIDAISNRFQEKIFLENNFEFSHKTELKNFIKNIEKILRNAFKKKNGGKK